MKKEARLRTTALAFLAVLLAVAFGLWLERQRRDSGTGSEPQANPPGTAAPPESRDPAWAGSQSCRDCHARAFEAWAGSHHALAERPLAPDLDRPAFVPERAIRHGSLVSTARENQGALELVTTGADGRLAPFRVLRAIGVSPLRQYLVEGARGRLQVTSLAFDPARGEWFDVFGAEDRKPSEWGFWANQGMTWNSMCAECHTTHLEKGYDARADSYSSRWLELGVGCEACHGPLAAHVAHQRSSPGVRPDPGLRTFSPDQALAACGSCHARRSNFTGAFLPGELFEDHFSAVLPDSDAYYPDGQVREEDFEFGSFLLSRMHLAGVRCLDCHEPHSGNLRLPGNDLCLSCHRAGASDGSAGRAPPLPPPIDPGSHSHHPPGKPGSLCADCHMPATTYMQRHARRDHGFTIPDPLLTAELGIPNACNRCHADRTASWAAEAMDRWYGAGKDRPARARARAVAAGRRGDESALPGLLDLARREAVPAWRAVAMSLFGRYARRPEARSALREALNDPHPLVRARAVESLEAAGAVEERMLSDPARLVRLQAAWALRRSLDPGSPAASDLLRDLSRQLASQADQPAGALALGEYLRESGRPDLAEEPLRRAVRWDPYSPPLRQGLASALSALERTEEAREVMEEAARLAPRDPELLFSLGLARAECGRLQEAEEALEAATNREPAFARAWYNLGLARSRLGRAEEALAALARAEELDRESADPPAARAGVLVDLGRLEEARDAARRALEIDRAHPGALRLWREMEGR